MMRIDPDRVADALLNAPGWARVGIAAPKESTREAAAHELALTIAHCLDDAPVIHDPNQLPLAF